MNNNSSCQSIIDYIPEPILEHLFRIMWSIDSWIKIQEWKYDSSHTTVKKEGKDEA